jgi:hypothetical protein
MCTRCWAHAHCVIMPSYPSACKFLRCSVNKFNVLTHLVYEKEFVWSSFHQCIPQDSFCNRQKYNRCIVWIMGWESEEKLIRIDNLYQTPISKLWSGSSSWLIVAMALLLSLHHERELKIGVDRVQKSSKRLQSNTGVKWDAHWDLDVAVEIISLITHNHIFLAFSFCRMGNQSSLRISRSYLPV